MNNVKLIPNELHGDISIPPSKSMCHRAIICAGLANGRCYLENIEYSDDINATINAMRAFGVSINKQENSNNKDSFEVIGTEKIDIVNNVIDCCESGSTIRFLIPISRVSKDKVTFVGKGKLVERPLDIYYNIFDEQEVIYSNDDGKLPLSIKGGLKPAIYRMKGNISSQFITGLLFALPLLEGDSKIIITTELESKGYVDLTLDMLNQYGIDIINNDYKEFVVKGNQVYKPNDYTVEGDFSQAAFWIVAGIFSGDIECKGLKFDSLQGDKVILDIVKKMGADINLSNDDIIVNKSRTKGITIDASQCPDLVPILAVLGALSDGTTEIINAARLRIKESDRLKAITTELTKLGADIEELEDGLIIRGKEYLCGGEVDSWNDHRIAMALAIASIKCKEPVIINNSSAVNKSYPRFFSDFSKLGGIVHEWNMGQ